MLKKISVFTIILLVLISFSFAVQKEVPKKAIKLIEKANESLTSGDIEKATKQVNKAIVVYPDYAGIYTTLGKINITQNNFTDGKKNFRKALTLDSDDKEATKYLSQILIQEGQQIIQKDAKKALALFKEVLALKNIQEVTPKGYVQLIYTCGRIHQRYNQSKESNKYFNDFLKIPDVKENFAVFYAPTFFSLAINYAQLEDIEKSNQNIEKFLALSQPITDQNKPLVARANYILGSNNFELLEKDCEKIKNDTSIKKNKEKNDKMAGLASKVENKIKPYLLKAIELDPNFEGNYKFLGNFYARQLKLNEAIAQFDKLVTEFPGSENITIYKNILETLKKRLENQKKKK